MARQYAAIFTRIWHDPDFLALSSGAQRLFMLALSQDTLSFCGVTGWSLRRWASFAPNTTEVTIEKDMTELAGAAFVLVDHGTEELFVRSFFKWDGVLSMPNLIKAMATDFERVHSGRIRDAILEWFADTYPEGFLEGLAERFPKAFGKGFTEPLQEMFPEGFSRACTRDHLHLSPSPHEPLGHGFTQGTVDNGSRVEEEEGKRGIDHQAITDAACAVIADRELVAYIGRGGEVATVNGWLATSKLKASQRHHQRLKDGLATGITDPTLLADYCEPVHHGARAPKRHPHASTGPPEHTELANEARARIMARNDRPPCTTCNTRIGKLELPDGSVTTCPDC